MLEALQKEWKNYSNNNKLYARCYYLTKFFCNYDVELVTTQHYIESLQFVIDKFQSFYRHEDKSFFYITLIASLSVQDISNKFGVAYEVLKRAAAENDIKVIDDFIKCFGVEGTIEPRVKSVVIHIAINGTNHEVPSFLGYLAAMKKERNKQGFVEKVEQLFRKRCNIIIKGNFSVNIPWLDNTEGNDSVGAARVENEDSIEFGHMNDIQLLRMYKPLVKDSINSANHFQFRKRIFDFTN